MMFAELEKSAGVILQPVGSSARPPMVNRLWTPPSGVPSGLRMKRASLAGPFKVMNGGRRFCELAKATKGLLAGLEPPLAGWLWHEKQELEL
jgi:hypothetical protein